MSSQSPLISTLLSLALFSCVRVKSADNSLTNTSTSSRRYQGELPLGETITLESPMTPLAEAIRAKILDDLRRRDGTPSPSSQPPSLPNVVKEAILDVLRSQAEGASASSEDRPCRVRPDWITPGEIFYSLQRAALGSTESQDVRGLPSLRNRSWASILGYKTNQAYLMEALETWFKELEKENINSLTPMVKDSLGLKLVPFDERFWFQLIRDNWDQSLRLREHTKFMVHQDHVNGSRIRCFFMGQLHVASSVNGTGLLNLIRSLEALRMAPLQKLFFSGHWGQDIINSKDTVTGIHINSYFNAFLDSNHIFDYGKICNFTIQGLSHITDEAGRRIKKIRITIKSNPSIKSFILNNLTMIDPNLLARSMIGVLRKKFPNATEYQFISSKKDHFKFLNGLLKEGAKAGIKRFGVAFTDSLTVNQPFDSLPTLKGVESLVIDSKWSVKPDVSKLLASLPDLTHLRIRSEFYDNSPVDFSKYSPRKLSHLTMTGCWQKKQSTTFSFPQSQFPQLKSVTIDDQCQKWMRLEQSPHLTQVLRQLTPQELIELVQSNAESGDQSQEPAAQ